MCQQEQEQSLANILGENTDKMQLTRKILDLKQVGDSRQQPQKLLLNYQQDSIIGTGKQLAFFEITCMLVSASDLHLPFMHYSLLTLLITCSHMSLIH